jgi:shikimate kinase
MDKKKNVVMIGMPASGKSTLGVILAKVLGYSFVDVDLVIQEKEGKRLKDIISEIGDDGFLALEDRINSEISAEHAVISPGGSVIYGKNAMEHYKEIATVVYLRVGYETLEARLGNLAERGVVLKEGMTLRDLYEERVPYYEKYADITVDETGKKFQEVVNELKICLEPVLA